MNNDTHPSEQQPRRTPSVAADAKALSRARWTLATLGIGLVLGACGQKGPLVRPQGPSYIKPAPEAASAPSPSPAASDARP